MLRACFVVLFTVFARGAVYLPNILILRLTRDPILVVFVSQHQLPLRLVLAIIAIQFLYDGRDLASLTHLPFPFHHPLLWILR